MFKSLSKRSKEGPPWAYANLYNATLELRLKLQCSRKLWPDYCISQSIPGLRIYRRCYLQHNSVIPTLATQDN